MKTYLIILPNKLSQICTRNAVTELPSVYECIRDARDAQLLKQNELPIVIFNKRILSDTTVLRILNETVSK